MVAGTGGAATGFAASIGAPLAAVAGGLGTGTTRALGVRPRSQQALLIGAAVVAVSVATAAVGPIAFVGLIAPQVARRVLRTPGEPLIGSALTGAVVVLGADILARAILPADPPVGPNGCGKSTLLRARVLTDPVSARPMIVPIGTRHVHGTVGGPNRHPRQGPERFSTGRFEGYDQFHEVTTPCSTPLRR